MNSEQLRKRIYNRLASERGSFVYNPSIGSNLFLMTRAKNLSDVHDLAQGYIREALLPELQKGSILAIGKVQVKTWTQNKIEMEVAITANNKEVILVPMQFS